MEKLIATNIDSKTNIRKLENTTRFARKIGSPRDLVGPRACTSKKNHYRDGSDEINQQNRRQKRTGETVQMAP